MRRGLLGVFILALGAVKILLVKDSDAGHRAGLILIVFGRAILTKNEREADLVAKQLVASLEVSEPERKNK